MKIKFQISKSFVRFEDNCKISKPNYKQKTVFKIFSTLSQIVLEKCDKKYSITSLPIFSIEEGIEAKTQIHEFF